jgi:hypothetical protein
MKTGEERGVKAGMAIVNVRTADQQANRHILSKAYFCAIARRFEDVVGSCLGEQQHAGPQSGS